MLHFSNPLHRPESINENHFKEPYYLWHNSCDNDFIDRITNLGESLVQIDAQIGDKVETSVQQNDMRNSKLSWIYHNDESKFLFDFLIDKVTSINYYHYGMAIHGMEELQYSRYPVGGHYTYHNDIVLNNGMMRKLSIVLALTDNNEYDGGEFLLMPHGINPQYFKFQKGDLICFPSYIPHKVEPVTRGHRTTLVTWMYGPTFV